MRGRATLTGLIALWIVTSAFNHQTPPESVAAPLATFTVTVAKVEDGGKGNVSSSPAGINCGPKCTATFESGTSMTLVASATQGQFARWISGPCHDSRNPTCTFVLTANTKATARFIK